MTDVIFVLVMCSDQRNMRGLNEMLKINETVTLLHLPDIRNCFSKNGIL